MACAVTRLLVCWAESGDGRRCTARTHWQTLLTLSNMVCTAHVMSDSTHITDSIATCDWLTHCSVVVLWSDRRSLHLLYNCVYHTFRPQLGLDFYSIGCHLIETHLVEDTFDYTAIATDWPKKARLLTKKGERPSLMSLTLTVKIADLLEDIELIID